MTYLGYQDRIRYRQSIILQLYYKANLKITYTTKQRVEPRALKTDFEKK